MSGFNLTALPEVFSTVLGMDLEPTAIFLTLIGLMAIIVFLAVLEINKTGMALVGITYLAFCTYMAWFPIWIMIIISLVVAVLVGQKTVAYIKGGSEGD